MSQKQLRLVPLVKAETSLGNAKLASFNPVYPTFLSLSQEKPDAVMLIAARYRIAPATARAHVEAFGFGGSRL